MENIFELVDEIQHLKRSILRKFPEIKNVRSSSTSIYLGFYRNENHKTYRKNLRKSKILFVENGFLCL